MKIIKKILYCAVFLLVLSCFSPKTSVYAETTLESLEIPQEISLELVNGEVQYATILNLSSNFHYTTKLFDIDDDLFSNPISETNYYSFEDIGEYNIVFTVFDNNLNNKEFVSKLSIVDTSAPTMLFSGEYKNEYSMNEKVNIIKPEVIDNNKNGRPSLDIKVIYNDQIIEIIDDSFVADRIGRYSISYTATDKSNNTINKIFVIENKGNDFLAPEIVFSSEYEKKYKVGSEIPLIIPYCSDNVDENCELIIDAYINGSEIDIENNKIKVNDSGEVNIVYKLEDSNSNKTYMVKTFEIVEKNDDTGFPVYLIICILGGVVVVGVVIVLVYKRRKYNEKD